MIVSIYLVKFICEKKQNDVELGVWLEGFQPNPKFNIILHGFSAKPSFTHHHYISTEPFVSCDPVTSSQVANSIAHILSVKKASIPKTLNPVDLDKLLKPHPRKFLGNCSATVDYSM
jgi:hypothetical protein